MYKLLGLGLWLIAPISSIIGLLTAIYLFRYVSEQEIGGEKIKEVADAIKEGANAFLKREFKTLAIVVTILAIIFSVFINIWTGPIFIFGAVCSAFAGFLGMRIAVKANSRTANAAQEDLEAAFPITYRGGAVMGLSVVGMALLGISIIYWLTEDPGMLLGFALGAGVLALFSKVGGGIYTKTADIGADVVGKVELGLKEDDPRNPAVIADNVGDNVGDVAGMGSDLYDSYVAAIMSSMILGAGFTLSPEPEIIPLIFAGIGVIASIISVMVTKVGKGETPERSLNLALLLSSVLFGSLTFLVTWYKGYSFRIWGAAIIGLISGVIIGLTGDYFTSIRKKPARKTAKASQTGTSINIISGFSYGLISVIPPLIGVGIASMVAYYIVWESLYGVGIAAVGMLSIVGTVTAADAYGPIGDNAKGIGEQAGLDEETISIADELDAAGNTVKAISKGFAIGAAGLTAIALLASYQQIAEVTSFSLTDPIVMFGIFVGITIPGLFSALSMLAVSDNSYLMVKEIRRQFEEIPGLREGNAKPDYAECVDVATKAALEKLFLLIILTIGVTLAVGFLAGVNALAGYIAGSIFSGFMLAILMANSGGLWDNAKKYIEDGHFGGTGSEAHKAAVVGDTVGDPFKDTAGPSLNTLIVVMSETASLFAPLIVKYALI